VDSDLGGAMVGPAQSRNRLEDGRGKNDKMSRRVWKAVEANAEKIRVAETEGGRSKGRSGKETRKEKGKEETKKRKNSRDKKGNGRMGDIG